MSEEEIIEENIKRHIKEHSRTIKAYTQEYVDKLQKQLQQKENIINKLEKWLEQEYAVVKANSIQEPNNPEWYIKWNERKNTLDKLQELKGSDK